MNTQPTLADQSVQRARSHPTNENIVNAIVDLNEDVRELKTDVRELKADVRELKTDVGKLLHHFGLTSGGTP